MRIRNMETKMKTVGNTSMKCVVVGNDGTGKTSMIASYATGSILGEHVPTVFNPFNIFDLKDTLHVVENMTLTRTHNSTFTVVDTANQESYDKQRVQEYVGCDVIMICFPVISRREADDIRMRWLPEFEQHARSVPILLVGTKADLRVDPETIENQGLQSIMSKSDGSLLAKNLGAQGYIECSAIEHVGLDEVFEKAREVAKAGYIRGLSKRLSRNRNSRNRASNFFKYLLCGKSHKDSSRVR